MSSSNPYQSRLFKFVVQQTRQLRDRSVQRWRQLRLGIVWGTQVVVYPIYAVFQATRLAERQLRQAVRQTMPQLQAAKRAIQARVQTGGRAKAAPPAMRSPSEIVAVDAPVTKTLEAVEALFLLHPHSQPFFFKGLKGEKLVSRSQPSFPESNELSLHPQSSVLEKGKLVSQSQPSISEKEELVSDLQTSLGKDLTLASTSFLQATATQLEAVQDDPVRGMATLLSTQKLVLTTVQNRILEITPEQEDYLRRRLIAEMADYLRQWRQLALQSRLPLLPPPALRPNALPPVRLFYELMRWMQRSSVAIAVNLFNEATWAANILENAVAKSGMSFETNDPWDGAAVLQQPDVPSCSQGMSKTASNSISELTSQTLPSQKLVPLLSGSRRLVLAIPQALKTVKTVKALKTIKTRATAMQSNSPCGAIVIKAEPMTSLASQPLSPLLEPVSLAEMQIQPSDSTSDLMSDLIRGDRTLQPAALQQNTRPDAIDTQATLVKYVKHPLQQVLEWIDLGMVWIEKRVVQFVSWLRQSL